MRQTAEPPRRGPHSVLFLKALAEEGRTVFTTSEAKQIAVRSGIPEGYVTNLLMIMVRNGWLTRWTRMDANLSSPPPETSNRYSRGLTGIRDEYS